MVWNLDSLPCEFFSLWLFHACTLYRLSVKLDGSKAFLGTFSLKQNSVCVAYLSKYLAVRQRKTRGTSPKLWYMFNTMINYKNFKSTNIPWYRYDYQTEKKKKKFGSKFLDKHKLMQFPLEMFSFEKYSGTISFQKLRQMRVSSLRGEKSVILVLMKIRCHLVARNKNSRIQLGKRIDCSGNQV